MKITKYNAICNLGHNINEIFSHAINGEKVSVELDLPEIEDADYNLRCNKLALLALEPFDIEKLKQKYGAENIGVVVATTNTGVEEFEQTRDYKHAQMGNPAEFVKKYFGLNNYHTSVSTACSSGIKAFSIARELIDSEYSKAVIVIGVDSFAKIPKYGFDSLEILSKTQTNPFGKGRSGINIGEGVAAFVVEDSENGIEIAGIGETTDFYHSTTPNPEAIEAIEAIKIALKEANIETVDYINLHGTGTQANDLMEAKAISTIFGKKLPVASSTKPLTGHCLGAAASVETALCCKLLDSKKKRVFPHIYSGEYDDEIPQINLADANTTVEKLETILNTSFGFGGTNCAMILRRKNG